MFKLKNSKRLLCLGMAVMMLCTMASPAFAADTQKADTAGSQTVIPVTITAEATQLDVDIPTAFPVAVDRSGETEEPTNLVITNNSYGAIVVSNITAKDNASNHGGTATWHLAAFDKDMSQTQVDSNLIGLRVAPKGGRSNAAGTDFLATTDGSASEQVLLSSVNSKWVIDGATTQRDTDQLTVVYETNVSAVSSSLTNETVANIVITIGWYTGA